MMEMDFAEMCERAKQDAASYLETFCEMTVAGYDGYSCPDGRSDSRPQGRSQRKEGTGRGEALSLGA